MPLTALGRVLEPEQGKTVLYVARRLAEDSAWPFERGEQVRMTIDPKRRTLLVEKMGRIPAGKTLAVGLLAVLLAVSGCLQGPGPGNAMPSAAEPREAGSTRVASASDPDLAPALGSIEGRVTDDEFRPLPNATLHLRNLDVALSPDAQGAYSFLDVPVGRHVVEVQAAGHAGASKAVTVEQDASVRADFALTPLAVEEPHVTVLQHTTLIHWSVYGLFYVTAAVPNCSDNCSWWFPLGDPAPDQLLFQVTGRHSTANPRGWDGLRLGAIGYPLGSDKIADAHRLFDCLGTVDTNPNHPCLRLPLRVVVNNTVLTSQDHGGRDPRPQRVNVLPQCEDSWWCLEERYDTYVSFFYDWGEEIPPDYTALPGG